DEARVAERIVAAGADHQMRRVVRQTFQLPGHVFGDRTVHRQQRRLPAGWQHAPQMIDHRRAVGHIARVVENRVSQKNYVTHERHLHGSRIPLQPKTFIEERRTRDENVWSAQRLSKRALMPLDGWRRMIGLEYVPPTWKPVSVPVMTGRRKLRTG